MLHVSSIINSDIETVWNCFTQPEHITKWNFADPSWHCPAASNELRIGGRYFARMEAKDGSFGFDFEAIYTEIIEGETFTYEFGGRLAKIDFIEKEHLTELVINFDPETENPVELQKTGWQAILNNFKNYVETN